MQRLRTPRQKRASKRHEGVACVEFALVLPILLSLVLGILEVGRYVEVRQILTGAVREGARQASTGQLTNAQVVNVVTGCVQAAGLTTKDLAVTVADLTNPGTDVSLATCLDNLQVTATMPYADVRWSTTNFFTNATTQITATSYWDSSNPQSYPNNVTAPAGS